MTVSAEMVKNLRRSSGAGIMECKEALKESGGDIDTAIDFLRKKGAARAIKKAERSTREGAVSAFVSGEIGALVEVKCETDFVARNDVFQTLSRDLAQCVAESGGNEDSETFLKRPFIKDPSKTVNDIITEKIHELGENITLGRFVRFTLPGSGGFGSYIHGAGTIGVLVDMASDSSDAAENQEFIELGKDIAMHIAASAPVALDKDSVPEDVLAKEKEILEVQARESGKPEKIISKIVEGRLKKYFSEICLLEQTFVKNPDDNVREHIEKVSKTIGAKVSVRNFSRFGLGE